LIGFTLTIIHSANLEAGCVALRLCYIYDMEAVIIAGGYGTRLYPLTLERPKSLLPFLDRPIIEYQLDLAREAGCQRAFAATGHMSADVETYVDSCRFDIHLVTEEEPLGTGGAVALALRSSNVEPPVMVLNGDIVCDIAPRSLLETHKRLGAWLTIAAADVLDASSFGTLTIDETESLLAFNEKLSQDAGEEPTPVNAGIYLMGEKACAELASREGAFSLEEDFFPELARQGLIRVHRHKGFWRDVGTLDRYFKTQFDILGYFLTMGRENFGGDRDDYALFRDFIYIHQDAQLGDNCDLFHRVILMRGAKLGNNCYLRNCIVLPGGIVGNQCRLESVLVDSDTTIPDGTEAESRAFSGDREEVFTG